MGAIFSKIYGQLDTLSHLTSFMIMIIMMPLKRCVAKENYLNTLLSNEARNNVLMSVPLDGAAVILYSHLVMLSFPDKFGSD